MAPEPALATAPGYRPAVQGLRAIAVLLVVAYHAGLPAPGGFTGVDVFFVISGFVIAEMLRREWSATGTIALGEFFRRRVRRLLPALALVVAVTVVLHALLVAPLEQPARTALTGLGGLLLSANVVIALTTGDYFDAPAETNPLLHLWSLSVEEQFYLVLPLVLLLAWRWSRSRGRGGPLPVVMLLGAVSIGILAVGASGHALRGVPDAVLGFYSPVVRTWEFLVGVALALTTRWRDLAARARRSAGAAGVILLVAATFAIDGGTAFPCAATLLPVTGAALLIIAAEGRTGRLHDALASRAMVAIGDRSYGWYLWHWPAIVLATVLAGGPSAPSWVAPVAAIASLAPAWWSYHAVELPIRVRRTTPLRPVLLGALVAPLAVVALVAVGSAAAWWSPALVDAREQVEARPRSRQAGCHAFLAERGEERFRDCWFGPEADAAPILLLGDSNAAVASDPVILAGERLGRPVFVSTGSDCPPYVAGAPGLSPACEELLATTYRWLGTQPPGDVFLVATDYPWYSEGAVLPDTAAYVAALRTTVEAVRDAGHRPVLVTPIPAFIGLDGGMPGRIWRLSNCTSLAFVRGACGQSFAITAEWPQSPLWRATAMVAVETGAGLVDLTEHVCPGGVCRTDRAGTWDYRDGTHLSVRRSVALVDVYADAVRDR
jgi:peptidoglycan/LPS O-acetylase OafA/YrhL